MCEIAFPDTPTHAAKPMECWDLKSEGSIADVFVWSKRLVQTYEIRVSEADSPQDGYTKISNVLPAR